jgi:hypothetical protein
LLKRYGVSPRFLAACVSAIAILLQGPSAAAEGEPAPADPWAHRPVSLLTRMEAGGGEMGPTGLVGLVLEITPARWFSLSGDAGAGFDGTQLAAMARGRLFVTKNTALGLGVGASSGAYVDTDEPWLDFCFVDCPRYHRREWGSASWGNGRWLRVAALRRRPVAPRPERRRLHEHRSVPHDARRLRVHRLGARIRGRRLELRPRGDRARFT